MRALLIASIILAPQLLSAQPIRRNDVIAFVDRLKCSEPHRYDTSGDLIPGGNNSAREILRLTPAGTLASAKRYAPTDKTVEGLGQLRIALSSMAPCADAWTVHVDVFAANAGQYAGMVEASLPGIPFGHRGDNGNEAVGGFNFYGGASTARDSAYNPALDLTREFWGGATLRFDVPGMVWIPGLGRGLITMHIFASAQGNYAWGRNQKEARGHSLVPQYNLSLPITILRDLPLVFFRPNIVGLGYSYERIENFAGGQSLSRHLAGLTTSWFSKHVDITVHGGVESLGGGRIYRVVGLSVKPAICTICQHSF